jgi:hypothetical protein
VFIPEFRRRSSRGKVGNTEVFANLTLPHPSAIEVLLKSLYSFREKTRNPMISHGFSLRFTL